MHSKHTTSPLMKKPSISSPKTPESLKKHVLPFRTTSNSSASMMESPKSLQAMQNHRDRLAMSRLKHLHDNSRQQRQQMMLRNMLAGALKSERESVQDASSPAHNDQQLYSSSIQKRNDNHAYSPQQQQSPSGPIHSGQKLQRGSNTLRQIAASSQKLAFVGNYKRIFEVLQTLQVHHHLSMCSSLDI